MFDLVSLLAFFLILANFLAEMGLNMTWYTYICIRDQLCVFWIGVTFGFFLILFNNNTGLWKKYGRFLQNSVSDWEERKKTKELLQKIKDSKEGGSASPAPAPAVVEAPDTTIAEQATEAISAAAQQEAPANPEPEQAAPAAKDDKSMFSDY